MAKLLNLTDAWGNLPYVKEHLTPNLSEAQRDLMTPVIINSNNIDGFRRAFLELFRKTGILFSPLSFRYSYAFNVSGKRNVTVVPKYYIEKDVNLMLTKYKIVTHVDGLVPTGEEWEEEALHAIKYFHTDCIGAQHKLIKTKLEDDTFVGWECSELFPDKPV